MTEPNSSKGTPKSVRIPGYDVARAIAVLGMILVNYQSKMEAGERGPEWLIWIGQRLHGRAAALFVILAGIGLALRSRRARENPAEHLAFERSAVLKRAAVLLFAGLLNLHMWEWDILHFYAVFLAIAAFLLNAKAWILWSLSGLSILGGALLQLKFDYHAEHYLWTLKGAIQDLTFNGLHPVFPWMAFLLIGMWLGRLRLDERSIRTRVLIISLSLMVIGEGLDSLNHHFPELFGFGEDGSVWLSSWPHPPGPLYVLTAMGTAVSVICLSIELTQHRPEAGWVVTLMATGQLAFTLYIAHAIAIVIPQRHGLLEGCSLATSMIYSVAFYLIAIAGSVWWRRRFKTGPLEGFIRQLTSRTTPAPWGGKLMS